MKRNIFQILGLVCFLVGLSVGAAFAEAPVPADDPEASARQLRIYRDSLLQGSTEAIRVDAAVGLLLRDDDASREALVSVLSASDNPAAQQAVCKALIKSRGLGQTIRSRTIYLDPLMAILASDKTEGAVLAAEALLLYGYPDIEKGLEAILTDEQATRKSRLNVVYTLQIRSEPQSLARLVGLLDDADVEVARAAENALQEAFGIPVGASRQVWDEILEKLKKKSPDDIRRELLLTKETRLRQVQADRDKWQKLYLGALDKQYEGLDEAGRRKMTLEMLSFELAPVRVWALGKAAQYPPADQKILRDQLLLLLGDASRDVRLQTARILNNMSALNPAEALLKQFRVEEDFDVRLALFEALGEACFFAFSEGSDIVLSAEIKRETLLIAEQYLASDRADASQKGAEAIRKMLELNNLSSDSVNYYLVLLAGRYEKAMAENTPLQAGLLTVMSHLCGQGVHRTQACLVFVNFFRSAIESPGAELRLAALRGMISADSVEAMRIVRKNALLKDESQAVRKAAVDLSGPMGGPEELGPLVELLTANGQGDAVWLAIKQICQRQTSDFLLKWADELRAAGRLEKVREILELAEQKAVGENNAAGAVAARAQLIRWYRDRKLWDAGAEYLENIGFLESDSPFKGSTSEDAFLIYLYSGRASIVSQVIQKKVALNDFSRPDPFLETLQVFLEDPSVLDDTKRTVFEALLVIEAVEGSVWGDFRRDLSNLYRVLLLSGMPEGDQPGSMTTKTVELTPEN